MKKLMLMKSRQLFFSILLPFLLCAVLIIAVQSAWMYNDYERSMLDAAYSRQQEELQYLRRSVQSAEESARALATQMFFNSTVQELLYTQVGYEDFQRYINCLASYKNIYSCIDSIYIYTRENVYVLPSYQFRMPVDTFYDQDILGVLADINRYPSHSILPRQIPYNDYHTGVIDPSQPQDVYSYLFYQSQRINGGIKEAIILNLKSDWLWPNDAKQGLDASDIFILDGDGRLISDSRTARMLTDLSTRAYVQRILGGGTKGQISDNVEGVESLITYAQLERLNWRVVAVTPLADVLGDVEAMRQRVFLLALLLLLLAAGACMLLSRRLFVPIHLLIQNAHRMESERQRDATRRRGEQLKDLLNGGGGMASKASEVLGFDAEQRCVMFLVRIDYFHALCSQYNRAERTYLKQSIAGMLETDVLGSEAHACVEMEEDRIAAVCQYRFACAPRENAELGARLERFGARVRKELLVTVSVTVSSVADGFFELDYQSLVRCSYQVLVLGHGALIYRDEEDESEANFAYPLAQEKALREQLTEGHEREAKTILKSVLGSAALCGAGNVKPASIRLLMAIASVADQMRLANKSLSLDLDFNELLNEIQWQDTLEEIEALFVRLVEDIVSAQDKARECRYQVLVEQVKVMIEEECADSQLSLETISQKVGLSPAYLSKLFRGFTNVSMPSYISSVRLEKAVELLTQTDTTIGGIMEQLGFISTGNFFTLFKRRYGVTPAQYRKQARGDGSCGKKQKGGHSHES